MRYAELVSERLLKPLGAEASGYITVDRIGGARAAGGKCLLARDLARVGMMMANGGQRDGKKIIPASWIEDIVRNGDPKAWKDGDFYDNMGQRDIHYRSKWYIQRGTEPMIFGSEFTASFYLWILLENFQLHGSPASTLRWTVNLSRKHSQQSKEFAR
jgi:CubicO group peptidase (beta-lactamase class C family)